MTKKPRTAAQLANDQRLRDRKKAVETTETPPESPLPESSENVTQALLLRMMKEIDELKANQTFATSPEQALNDKAKAEGYNVDVGRDGVKGRVFKYPVDKSYYPDPTERLYAEPTLRRFNLKDNFYITWDVEGVEYEKYGVTYAEPRFIIHLYRRLFDEDGITPTGKLALVNRQMQHEDEVASRKVASKLGLTDEFEDFRSMMDEMRYQRIRQWLLELFTPVKVNHHARQATQMVIDGKVVEIFDTEMIIDGDSGISKASSIESQVRV